MSPVYHEGDEKHSIPDWGSHVDRLIREAQQRGEFDNLPGAGKPLDLGDDNPFEAAWATAFRVAKNAGAAPLWVELDKGIGAAAEALRTMLERTAGYMEAVATRIRQAAQPAPPWAQPRSFADLETERQRARNQYLAKAAELDRLIQEYNASRPRQLTWLEKPRLLPETAARQFDARCPAL